MTTVSVRLLSTVIIGIGFALAGCGSNIPISNIDVDPSPRGALLAQQLEHSDLRRSLTTCDIERFQPKVFSIAHRGAPLGYPEHSKEGYEAAAKMGAGMIECDVTFTKDLELVCRHSQCDLHSTTNILQTDLARTCDVPFEPANTDKPASAKCCTSSLTLAEFKSLCARRDSVNAQATTVEQYLEEPPNKVLGEPISCGTLMTHSESIQLIDSLGVQFVPELKAPMVPMPFNGMGHLQYASKMLDEYSELGIAPERVHPQSFNLADILYWNSKHTEFGPNTIFLDNRGRQPDFKPSRDQMLVLKSTGVSTIAPPIPMLIQLDTNGDPQATEYAELAREAGLDVITWTLESGDATDPHNWLYASLRGYMTHEAKMLEVIHVLRNQVGIKGIFSDWPGTVTYYANCMDTP